jgi:hypothetical protein
MSIVAALPVGLQAFRRLVGASLLAAILAAPSALHAQEADPPCCVAPTRIVLNGGQVPPGGYALRRDGIAEGKYWRLYERPAEGQLAPTAPATLLTVAQPVGTRSQAGAALDAERTDLLQQGWQTLPEVAGLGDRNAVLVNPQHTSLVVLFVRSLYEVKHQETWDQGDAQWSPEATLRRAAILDALLATQIENRRTGRQSGAVVAHDIGARVPLFADVRLAEALDRVRSIPEGAWLLAVAAEAGTTVVTGDLPSGLLGTFQADNNTVIIATHLLPLGPEVVANVLAHELTHAADNAAGLLAGAVGQDCVAAEVRAFKAEARAWAELHHGQFPTPSTAVEALFTEQAVEEQTSPGALEAFVSRTYRLRCDVDVPDDGAGSDGEPLS